MWNVAGDGAHGRGGGEALNAEGRCPKSTAGPAPLLTFLPFLAGPWNTLFIVSRLPCYARVHACGK